jgi:hypothetical protein
MTLRSGNPAIERRDGDAEVAGNVPWGYSAGEQLLGRLDFAFGHLPLSSAFATELAGNIEAGAGSFDGKFPFHLGQAGHDMEEESSRCGAGVDGVGEALELHAVLVKFTNQVNEVLDAAAQPIQFPDDQRVTFAQGFLRFGETGPLGSAAADFVLEDLRLQER